MWKEKTYFDLSRDMEKNNISEIHEDAFLPLNNLKDL